MPDYQTKTMIQRSLLFISIVAISPVFGQDALLNCADIADSTARLSCYDKAMQASKNLPVLRIPRNTTQASSTPAGSDNSNADAGGSANKEVVQSSDPFGLEMKNGDNDSQANTRTFTVTDASHNKFTGWTIEFTNGQIWKQVGTDPYKIEPGENYIITRASLNSFMLGAQGKRDKIRITRVE